ncbi:MAG: hypothetical protein GEU28_06845 [Dehalococcoidia bacterium]|nr:hypothetical protein [Dehalococcoidia bacterium]
MAEGKAGRLVEVEPYLLHGVQYYRLLIEWLDQPGTGREARIAHDAIYAEPARGDEVEVVAILNVVDRIIRRTED